MERKGHPGYSVPHLPKVAVALLLALTAWHLSLTFNTGDPRSRLPAFCQVDGLDKLENSEMGH